MAPSAPNQPPDAPGGFARTWPHDLLAGFLVFLIALPLCLGISLASGYPAVAGVLTAVIGGAVCPLISNSELTIKGPAAALIVVAVAAVIELGGGGSAHALADLSAEQRAAGYRLALATGVVAGGFQVLFALGRLGRLGECFPNTVVHGLLASVGVIIVTRQSYVVLGVLDKSGDVIRQLADLPATLLHPAANGVNPAIALVGGLSLLILFGAPLVPGRLARQVPAPLVVMLAGVPLGFGFDLGHDHTYRFAGRDYLLGERYLITLPASIQAGLTWPDLGALGLWAGWKYVAMFALVGSLGSLLSARAVDLLDPWQRKTSLDRDLLAVGVANVAAGLIGALPMLSEIVRSKASIDNGARTRWANAFHGLFLLGCVALLPHWLHHIPLAALGAMLVYTGCRLASPRVVRDAARAGRGQVVVLAVTVLAALRTDLLTGLGVGVATEFLLHLAHGISPRALLRADVETHKRSENDFVVFVRGAAVFSNWPGIKRRLEAIGADAAVTLDLSQTRLVDHTVMEKLHVLGREFARRGGRLHVAGLDFHRPAAAHPHAARVKRAAPRDELPG